MQYMRRYILYVCCSLGNYNYSAVLLERFIYTAEPWMENIKYAFNVINDQTGMLL